jgi:hypothetical protein
MKSAADDIKDDGRNINIDICIQRMTQAFEEYSATSIEIVWGVLFKVYPLILQDDSGTSQQ